MQVLGTGARIGKEGLKQGVIDEIRKQLRIKGVVKIKLLRSHILANGQKGRKEMMQEIIDRTGGEMVKSVGFVLILKRPGLMLPEGMVLDSAPKRFINKSHR